MKKDRENGLFYTYGSITELPFVYSVHYNS